MTVFRTISLRHGFFCLLPKSYSLLDYKTYAGADPGILVRGGGGFFFKGTGSGGRLRPLVGAQGAKVPEAPEF